MKPVKNFLNSNYFIALIYIITVVCWSLKIQTFTVVLSIALIILIILCDANRINIVTIIMAGYINYREATFNANIWYIIFASITLIPILVYDIVKTKVKFKDDVLISMLILFGVGIISLLNTNKSTITNAFIGLIGFFSFNLAYIYFNNRRTNNDYRYVAKNMMALGLAIAAEFFIYLLKNKGIAASKVDIDLGWAISNHIAIIYLTIIPMTIFLYLENQKRIYILLVVIIDLLVVFMTLSKGAYLALLIIAIPFGILIFIKTKDKKLLLRDLAISFVFLSIIALTILQFDSVRIGIKGYISQMNTRGWFHDEVRISIYKIGLNVFKKYPLFGAGPYTCENFLYTDFHVKNYHNYIIQTLATLGITGLIAFIYYIFTLIKRCWKVIHFYNICVFFVIIALLIHGLVDTTWYNPVIMVIISIYASTQIRKEEVNLEQLS